MESLTVIIPVGEKISASELKLFSTAFKSAEGKCDEIIVVGGSDAVDAIEKKKFSAKFIKNDTPTEPSNINLGVKECSTDFFSVLEFDDRYTDKWFDNAEKYIKEYDEVDKFAVLPLTEVVENGSDEAIGYLNEAFWASSFSENIGYADSSSMENYFGFIASGGIFRKKDFISLGGLKSSMKLVFWYEFMLRALYKEKNIFVVPKVGYIHTINRKGSLSEIYTNTMSEKESEWWVETANKEYYFPQDRNKVYEEE